MLEQLDVVERDLVERAAKAYDIKDATKNAAFQVLFAEAKSAAIAARNELVAVNPRDWRAIERLQNEVKRYEEMADWIRVALAEGDNALAQLEVYRGAASGTDDAVDPD